MANKHENILFHFLYGVFSHFCFSADILQSAPLRLLPVAQHVGMNDTRFVVLKQQQMDRI